MCFQPCLRIMMWEGSSHTPLPLYSSYHLIYCLSYIKYNSLFKYLKFRRERRCWVPWGYLASLVFWNICYIYIYIYSEFLHKLSIPSGKAMLSAVGLSSLALLDTVACHAHLMLMASLKPSTDLSSKHSGAWQFDTRAGSFEYYI
jgi:hypothetical protein